MANSPNTIRTQLEEFLRDPQTSALAAASAKWDKTEQMELLCAVLEQIAIQKQKNRRIPALCDLGKKLAGRKMPYSCEVLTRALTYAADVLMPKDLKDVQFDELDSPIPGVVPALLDGLETLAQQKPLSKALLDPLMRLHAALKPVEFWAGNKKTVHRLEALLEQKQAGVPDGGESWAEAIRREIETMPSDRRKLWLALLENAPKGTSAKPTAKWKQKADELLAAVGTEEFARQIELWFGLVGAKATDRIQPRNATLLRSLVWYASLLQGETVCRALANAVEGGLRKLPGGGLYASSISKACIAALETMTGLEPLAQLSRLKHRVKSPWGLEEVDKAFAGAVQRSGISRVEVEEITVPTFGLDMEGRLSRQIGTFTVNVAVIGTHEVKLTWLDAKKTELRNAPKLTGADNAEVKSVKQLAGDIEKMLAAQRDRLENFTERDRGWAFDVWRDRYLDHPLLSQMSRRLIWQFKQGKQTSSGIWHNGRLVDSTGKAIKWLGSKTEVRHWHPLGIEAGLVQHWRRWLEEHLVTQPFKQAHREIYLLTDAELATRTYSNRFAAHILRQHQFKALCDQRGWHYQFLGNWDQPESLATKELLEQNLRAEFWINPTGTEFSESGVALHVATDQVRFTKPDGQVADLVDVPALVFSEIMRDADLFVSVCCVGNDPTWADGGDARARDYWEAWSFGALNATAVTRQEILERLLPRLKIASQCSLADRYLVVRGRLRTYKIHLGSGNILMEPNDQYLCIVPDRKAGRNQLASDVFLPFEGDTTLAIVLSKAFLLAEDDKIKDSSILNQIRVG